MIRKLITIAVLVTALPLTAAAEDCATGTFDWSSGTPQWGSTHIAVNINTEVVGQFLWVQIGEDEIASVELEGTEASAVVCSTGTTFTYAAQVVNEQPVICDCTPEEYERFIEPMVFSIH